MATKEEGHVFDKLVQILSKKDGEMLSKFALRKYEDKALLEAARQLPQHLVVPFFIHLCNMIPSRCSGNSINNTRFPNLRKEFSRIARWLLSLLKTRYSVLKMMPPVEFNPLYARILPYVEATAKCHPAVNAWKARLDYHQRKKEIFEEIDREKEGNADVETEPKQQGILFNRKEELSDEDDDLVVASTIGASESEDNWDELSEAGYGGSDEDDSSSTALRNSAHGSAGNPEESEMIVVDDSDVSSDFSAEDVDDTDDDGEEDSPIEYETAGGQESSDSDDS